MAHESYWVKNHINALLGFRKALTEGKLSKALILYVILWSRTLKAVINPIFFNLIP